MDFVIARLLTIEQIFASFRSPDEEKRVYDQAVTNLFIFVGVSFTMSLAAVVSQKLRR